MVLFKIEPQSLTVLPREGDAPGAVNMDTVSCWYSVKAMKVKAWHIDFIQCFSLIENLQPTEATPLQGRLNLAAATPFE